MIWWPTCHPIILKAIGPGVPRSPGPRDLHSPPTTARSHTNHIEAFRLRVDPRQRRVPRAGVWMRTPWGKYYSCLRGSRGGAPRRHSNQRWFPSSSAALMYGAGTTSLSAHPLNGSVLSRPNLRERSAPRERDHCGIAEYQVGCRQFEPGGATVAAIPATARNTASLVAKSAGS